MEIGRADLASLVELIAHELEHVLEQLDDVNLTYMAQGPGVRSHRSERGPAFDTARARQIGLYVAAEFKAGSVAAAQRVVGATMKTRLAFGVLWLASARVITQDEEASRATVLLQRAVVHPGPATVDVSADGRFVAFESAAALVPADWNRSVDIYVLDRSTRNVTLESMSPTPSLAMGRDILD